MNLLEINVFILWFQSEFWNDFVAMKLPFSRINEKRKYSSYEINTLGPLCLWQCFHSNLHFLICYKSVQNLVIV